MLLFLQIVSINADRSNQFFCLYKKKVITSIKTLLNLKVKVYTQKFK